MASPQKPKCASCGHPWGKHSKGARGGCNVKSMKWATYNGRRQQRLMTCSCSGYRETENT